jgi:DNA-binding MarR family transcriptional regulator
MASHDFGILLGLAYQGFVDALHVHLEAKGFLDLGPTFGYVVRAIADAPGLTQRELAQRLGITEQGAGQIVGAMVRRRYLTRRPDPADARARRLELGARGHELLRVARAFHRAFERRLTRELGDAAMVARRALEHVVATASDESSQGRLRPM